jgi:glycosyltransferase involved in cell wall biosynthesis
MIKEKNLSIIIPHKNIQNLLERCLDSIPRRNDIQIIVVDDNSDKAKVDFNKLQALNDEYVEVVCNVESKGAGHARNTGLKIARGKWLIFADADDFFTSNFLNLFDKYLEKDLDVVYFGVQSVLSKNTSVKASRGINKFNNYYEAYVQNITHGELLFRYQFTEPWAKMIKISLVQKHLILFDETMVANDYTFAVKLGYYANKIFVDNNEIYVITLRNGSLSFNNFDTLDKLLTRIEVACNVTNFLDNKKVPLVVNPLRGLYITAFKKYPFSLFYITKYLFKRKINFSRLLKDIIIKRDKLKL